MFSARVSLLILRLREVSSLSVGNYIQFGRSHESDFHGITRFGSKICHRSVTCDTRVAVCDICAPLCNFCASLSRASHPYWTFHFDLRPLRLPGATQPWCNWAQCPPLDLCGIKSKLCGPHMACLFFSVGLHNPHSHPRTLSSWVTIAKVAHPFIV